MLKKSDAYVVSKLIVQHSILTDSSKLHKAASVSICKFLKTLKIHFQSAGTVVNTIQVCKNSGLLQDCRNCVFQLVQVQGSVLTLSFPARNSQLPGSLAAMQTPSQKVEVEARSIYSSLSIICKQNLKKGYEADDKIQPHTVH